MLWQEAIDMTTIPDQLLFSPGIGDYPEGRDAQQQVQGSTLHGAPTYPSASFTETKAGWASAEG